MLYLCPSIPFLVLLFFSCTAQAADEAACTILPSNNSQDLSWTGSVRFSLRGEAIPPPHRVRLAPLTQSLVNLNQGQLENLNIIGRLVNVHASNSIAAGRRVVAFVSCDSSAYSGVDADASHVVTTNILDSRSHAAAIVLYSTVSNHCNYTADDPVISQYSNIFTLLDPAVASRLREQVIKSRGFKSFVVANMSFVNPTTSVSSDGPNDDSNNPNTGSSSIPKNVAMSSPTTTVAMIILYSVTGIITALFLTIIITGAVRAHRHPERYGPRNTAGRPRQSRARGIARAMLDTIPIVKFGDPHDEKVDAVKGDVELGMDPDQHTAGKATECVETNETTRQSTQAGQTNADKEHNKEIKTEHTREVGSSSEPTHDTGNYVCPICTDDFVKGQDIRVLPCNHQFHPECIDPWLVNVSGTCPLCRIDLNPTHAGHSGQGDADNDSETTQETQPEAAADTNQTRHHRGLATYLQETLNVRRMLDASPEERLQALRTVRHVSREEANNGNENAEERQRRGTRLASRFRERFRIRTRRHGDPDNPAE